MAVGSYCYYEKVRRTMHTAIVPCLLKYFYSFSAAELNKNRILNIRSICNCFDRLFSVSYGYGFNLTFPWIFW